MTEDNQKLHSWRPFEGELLLFKRFDDIENRILVEKDDGNGMLRKMSDDDWVELKQLEKKLGDNQEIMISVPDIFSDDIMPKLKFIVQAEGLFKKQQQDS